MPAVIGRRQKEICTHANPCKTGRNSRGLEALHGLIKVSGAIRRFRHAIHRYGIADDWYKYHNNTSRQTAIEWCEENDIEFEDK